MSVAIEPEGLLRSEDAGAHVEVRQGAILNLEQDCLSLFFEPGRGFVAADRGERTAAHRGAHFLVI